MVVIGDMWAFVTEQDAQQCPEDWIPCPVSWAPGLCPVLSTCMHVSLCGRPCGGERATQSAELILEMVCPVPGGGCLGKHLVIRVPGMRSSS